MGPRVRDTANLFIYPAVQARKRSLSVYLRWEEGALNRHGYTNDGDAAVKVLTESYRVLGRFLDSRKVWPIGLFKELSL